MRAQPRSGQRRRHRGDVAIECAGVHQQRRRGDLGDAHRHQLRGPARLYLPGGAYRIRVPASGPTSTSRARPASPRRRRGPRPGPVRQRTGQRVFRPRERPPDRPRRRPELAQPRARTAPASSHASTTRYAGATPVADHAAWVPNPACSSAPMDSTAPPGTTGVASLRISASAECAVYSTIISPELGDVPSARNGVSPVAVVQQRA